ncbi:helix-turn-helix domain-containing protein [Aquibacillus sp. 3ASR75-11]|uniref:Helix-turn-helix domain-containing protein n=1 Tax=Terrihalobacillus insolitus TaxID=2950438 RepID=A0A9X3WP93_9BACI|nr:GAF domain-containing protein [Terrihalobacillus insolitus]MDC3423407.1 helix-turn-helix domain-containing protein [Terrihalobacillus insolitus]
MKNTNKVDKLLEINHLLTKSLDIEVILQTLVEEARNLLEVSDTVILYLFDPVDKVLRVAEGVGINKEIMKHIAFLPGESLTGKTYNSRESQLYAQEDILKENMANMSRDNYHYYFEGVFQRHIKSAFAVPLLYQDECLGVLIVDNFENDGYFTDEDIRVIEVIADQSAIAIVHSNLFRDLKERNEQLRNSVDIHKKFTKAILEGGGVDTILSLLSRILNTYAIFQDEVEQESTSAFPIIRGRETMGYIKLEKKMSDLSPLEVVAVEHAATALALELVKINTIYEKELHFREEVFQQMIEGIPRGDIRRIERYVGWSVKSDLVCIVLEGKQKQLWSEKSLLDKERFIRSLEGISQIVAGSSFVLTKMFQAILIIPVTKGNIVELMVERIKRQWRDQKDIIFGVGRKGGLNQLGNSYREALDAVKYGKITGESFVDYSNLGVERLLQKVDSTTLSFFVDDKIGPLLTMESLYLETLGAFIRLNKNHKETASMLHIHPNTLYQRIKKIEKALDASIDIESDWLNIVIAYNLYVSDNI